LKWAFLRACLKEQKHGSLGHGLICGFYGSF